MPEIDLKSKLEQWKLKPKPSRCDSEQSMFHRQPKEERRIWPTAAKRQRLLEVVRIHIE